MNRWIHEQIYNKASTKTNSNGARGWWLKSVILATQEVEIRRFMVSSQPRQIVGEITISK
jgi:hypothetical protein